MPTTRQQRKRAGAKRAAAQIPHDEIVSALEVEKAGYEQRGLTDRAKGVQSEITKHKAAQKKDEKSSGSSSSGGSGSGSGSGGSSSGSQSNRGSAKAETSGSGSGGSSSSSSSAADSGAGGDSKG